MTLSRLPAHWCGRPPRPTSTGEAPGHRSGVGWSGGPSSSATNQALLLPQLRSQRALAALPDPMALRRPHRGSVRRDRCVALERLGLDGNGTGVDDRVGAAAVPLRRGAVHGDGPVARRPAGLKRPSCRGRPGPRPPPSAPGRVVVPVEERRRGWPASTSTSGWGGPVRSCWQTGRGTTPRSGWRSRPTGTTAAGCSAAPWHHTLPRRSWTVSLRERACLQDVRTAGAASGKCAPHKLAKCLVVGVVSPVQSRCSTMLRTLPSGARTKNRRTPQGSVVIGYTIS